MKIRSVPVSVVAIIGCAGLAPAAGAQTTYTMTQIGDPTASYTILAGINNRGEIAGSSGGRSFLWRDGQSIDLTKELGAGATPEAINDLGQITGRYNGPSGGFLFSDGILTDLGLVKHSPATNPYALNNLGEVAFVALVFPEDTPEIYHSSYIYRNGVHEQIPTLGGTYVKANAINDSGVAAGDSTFKGDNQTHAIIYRNGETIDLGTLGGPHSSAYDINEAGYVTGRSSVAGSSASRAFILAAPGGRMIDLGVLPGGGKNSYGDAINNLNQVVGGSEIKPGSTEQHAFIYTDGQMWNLNKLIHAKDPSRGYVRLFAAYDINDNGWIIAGGVDERDPDVTKDYLLKPVAP
jgi:probable HAF family extracellular repeat protein